MRVGFNVLECVFMPDLLCDVVCCVFRCVFVLTCACDLRLMSLHAVRELSYDDVWCSMCLCVCVSVVCLCGLFVMYSVMLCGICMFV